MVRRAGALAVLVAAACCSKSEVKGSGTPGSDVAAPAPKPTFALFALAEVRGQIGPCGCTSDPLGDLSRTAKLVAEARAAGPVLVVDAGGLLYSQSPVPAHLVAQEDLKADLLVKTYQKELGVAAVGLGPVDLAKGPDAIRIPRQAVDVSDAKLVDAPKLIQVGDAKVGVFGVVAMDTIPGLAIGDPVATSKAAIADLKKRGAQVIVGLVQADSKKEAARLVRDIGGIDVAIAGLGLNAPEPDRIEVEAQKVGDGWLVVPANRGQVLARVDVTLRGGGPLVDAIGAGAAKARTAILDKQLADLDGDLARFAKDPTADAAFVKQKAAERAQLAAQRDKLRDHPLDAPAAGSYFTLDQIRISKLLACSLPVQDAITEYDRASGEANVKAAASLAVARPAPGAAGYSGGDACTDCHVDAAEFWKKTIHAQAWQTLVDRGQQFDYECIGCHVTGFDKPGGSNLGHTDKLRDVQCEVCHGPGSIHVAKGGDEKPAAIKRGPAEDLCASQCHTHEHSDTFQLEAYLRDITGPGHGAERRKKLGDGPTGHDLRKVALDKAGHSMGSGCTR